MASKQLGKLRQWAGEVISSREKSQPSSELIELEADMERRKQGIDRLHIASSDYVNYVSLTAHSEALPNEDKILHSEALGVVMIGYGEELGSESAYARSLSLYGRARCRIAALQNIFAVTFTDTFLASLDHSRAELDAYLAQRKKLESRRLAYDAAISKLEKIKATISKKDKDKDREKKEKDKREAEDELEIAKSRYEEIAEDMHARMSAIKEDEVRSQRELQNLLELELKYIEQYLDALKEVKTEWPVPDCYADLRRARPTSAAFHDFSRTSTRSSDSKSSVLGSNDTHGARKAPPVPKRFGSHRSSHSTHSHVSQKSVKSTSSTHDNESSDRKHIFSSNPDAELEVTTSKPLSRTLSLSRKSSTKSSKSTKSAKTTSRPSSRLSKKTKGRRRNSTSSIGTSASEDGRTEVFDDDDDDDSKNKKHKKSGSSVANWVGGVGDAVAGVMGGRENGKTRNTDVEYFAVLGDGHDGNAVESEDEEDDIKGEKTRKKPTRRMSSRSNRSTKSNKSDGGRSIGGFFSFGSKTPSKTSNGNDNKKVKEAKVMRAVFDFTGKADELSFRKGDEIYVMNEVLEEWWMGECNGQKGLFPVSYTTQVYGNGNTVIGSNGNKSDSGRSSGHTTPKRSKSKEKLKRNSFSSRSNSSVLLALGSHSRRGSTNHMAVEELESRRQLVASDSDLTTDSGLSPENSDDEHEHHLWQRATATEGTDSTNSHPFNDQRTQAPVTNGARTSNVLNGLSETLAQLKSQQQQPTSSSLTGAGSPVKRAPPPPPPRRNTSNSISGNGPPPLPTRNAVSVPSRIHSTISVPSSSLNPPVSDASQVRRAHSAGSSPFDSQSEISLKAASSLKCNSCGCDEFIEDPFRGRGQCANCTHEHI